MTERKKKKDRKEKKRGEREKRRMIIALLHCNDQIIYN